METLCRGDMVAGGHGPQAQSSAEGSVAPQRGGREALGHLQHQMSLPGLSPLVGATMASCHPPGWLAAFWAPGQPNYKELEKAEGL